MTASATHPIDRTGPITAAQRRAIFAAGRSRGLGIDELRLLTPDRSISALTHGQAANVLDRLNNRTERAHPRPARRGPRRPKGVFAIATDAQRRKVDALRMDLGWTHEGLCGWLAERHHADGRPMARCNDDGCRIVADSTADASAIIELLKAVLDRTEAGQ